MPTLRRLGYGTGRGTVTFLGTSRITLEALCEHYGSKGVPVFADDTMSVPEWLKALDGGSGIRYDKQGMCYLFDSLDFFS